MSGRPAVVVFGPEPDRAPRLSPPLTTEQAAALDTALLHDTLARLGAWSGSAGAAVRLYLDGDAASLPDGLVPLGVSVLTQRGDGLGARRLRALIETLASGHTVAVLVGADMPHLPTAFLDIALAELQTPMTAVVGPSASGGVVLLGLTEIVPAMFEAYEGRSEAFADTLDRAMDAGLAPVVLPETDRIGDSDALARLVAAWRAGEETGAQTADTLARLDADGVFMG